MKPTVEHRPIHVEVDVCFYKDYRAISVEGVNGLFCVRGEPCDGKNGTCPGVQTDLPTGSYCYKLVTSKFVSKCEPEAHRPRF